MKCQNCGNNEANIKYTEIINGQKKQYILCEECAEKLGINEKMNFNMKVDLGNFFGGFFDDYNSKPNLLNSFSNVKTLKCEKCGMTYDDFINSGKFGCENCYTVFSKRLDGVLKNIQGDSIHTGRKGKKSKKTFEENEEITDKKNEPKIEKLRKDLNLAIKEERYEDAAKIRDKMKEMGK